MTHPIELEAICVDNKRYTYCRALSCCFSEAESPRHLIYQRLCEWIYELV
ncbi:hypothetical protein SLEP1_g53178 [Rubroshorea leprosula]|uniref:Uncharacterized protein n=1 Tax=Rubroshorea leprosula TaxID=152421 RepID=A0AAV5M9I1_9ROSI|nr:hypothetical protein SLEP1_g53178 [Rubroshorea leprosula]